MNDSFCGRLGDLFRNPAHLMDNVGVQPRWWQPGLLVFFLIGIFTFMTIPISAPEQLELMRDSKLMQMMPEAQLQQQYDDALNISVNKRITQAVGAGLTTWVLVLIFSASIGFFARMSGGQGTMRQALGVGSWSAILPFGIASIVKLPLILATESVFAVNLGLVALLPGGDPGSPLYQILLTYGDLLTWWGLVVLIIGYRQVFGMTTNAAAIAVILPWILLSAVPLGLSLLIM